MITETTRKWSNCLLETGLKYCKAWTHKRLSILWNFFYTRQLSYAYHKKTLLMSGASNHRVWTSMPPGRQGKSIMRGYDTSTPRVECTTKTIFEHAMNPAMSPERTLNERTLAAETKTNNKGFWNYVNNRRKTKTKIADLRTNTSAFTSDDLEKADILNQQYVNTFTVEDLSSPPNFRPRQLQTQPLETVHITEEMVHKKLQSLRSDKSPGPEKLHPRILNTEMSHILNIVPIGTEKMHVFIIIITPIERSLRGHKFLYY